MHERAIKRLLVIFAVSLVAIMLFKTMMSRTIINLSMVAAEKKQAAAKLSAEQKAATAASDAAIIIETPATSAVAEGGALESSAVSGVSEAR